MIFFGTFQNVPPQHLTPEGQIVFVELKKEFQGRPIG